MLVVEDQDAVRQLAITILLEIWLSRFASLERSGSNRVGGRLSAIIHLLMTDIILPLMDGRVLADKLRAARPEIKVLYVSGYSEETIGRGKSLDEDFALLRKPFTSEMLGARVRGILSGGDQQWRTASKE